MDAVEVIGRCRTIAVLRSHDASHFAEIVDVLVSAGVPAVEFALTTPGALDALARYASSAPPEACLGAGTVLTALDARRAVDAGASYLVTPTFTSEVIDAGTTLGVPVFAGALTPTEILQAHTAGAAAVKVFPAALGGPSYLRLVRDPLPEVPLVPTGGVRLDDVTDYLDAGAFAVGMGSQLTGDAAVGGDLAALGTRAEQLVAAVDRAGAQR